MWPAVLFLMASVGAGRAGSLIGSLSGGAVKIGPAALRAPPPREGALTKWSRPGARREPQGAHGHRGAAEVNGAPKRSPGHRRGHWCTAQILGSDSVPLRGAVF